MPLRSGAEPAPEVRKCARRVAISRSYVALLGLETRSVTGETEVAGTWASVRSDVGLTSGTERRSVVGANSFDVICFKVKVTAVRGFSSRRTGDRVKVTALCVFHGGRYLKLTAFPVTGTSLLLNPRLLVVYLGISLDFQVRSVRTWSPNNPFLSPPSGHVTSLTLKITSTSRVRFLDCWLLPVIAKNHASVLAQYFLFSLNTSPVFFFP